MGEGGGASMIKVDRRITSTSEPSRSLYASKLLPRRPEWNDGEAEETKR
jgi:hypothetical protein